MKYLILTFVILLLTVSQPIFSQKKTSILETVVKKLEERIIHTNEEKKQIPSKTPNVSNSKKNKVGDVEKIVIPVVFHVVHKNYTSQILTKSLFDALLFSMNEGFNTLDYGIIDKDYITIAGISHIKFQYASSILPCASMIDISYHETNKQNFEFHHNQENEQQGFYDIVLKKNGYLDSKKVLNIWVCDIGGEGNAGYSTYPQEINPLNDGIVIDIGVLKSSNKEFKRIAISHELGHYFGLYHIWGKGFEDVGCTFNNGDKISDTPPQEKNNTYERVLNADIEKVCSNPFKLSNYQNYMDYSYLGGMFTNGQVDKMKENIKKYRSGLLKRNGCPETSNNVSTSPNTPVESNTGNLGEVCFSNPNMYSRKVILTNIKTGVATTISVGLAYYPKSTVRCAYNLELGVYNCKIYTTFTNKLTEEFQVKITTSTQEIKITKDGFN